MSPRRGTKKLYPIGELMEEFGVTNRALRFYEERGLLKPIRVSNAQVYSSQDRDRLATILEGKALGLTISEIAEALATGGDLTFQSSRSTLRWNTSKDKKLNWTVQ
jgi:DNA-binding transcriptional MerR regulator